ncbi:MAG: T9SS type A sorting domain-containing protein [Ignavibacteriales bacterium]|nr:T9SS type A sorting domain-containing protein [Ignavibacteriales bacterium]
MKKVSTLFFLITILLFLANNIFAQREVVIPPATGIDDVLNLTIMNDDHSQNTTYILQDGIYLINGAIDNDSWPLTITAEAGSELKPLIICIPDAEGNLTGNFINMYNNVTVKNIRFLNYYEDVYPEHLAIATGQFIRARAAGFDMVVENCFVSCRAILHTGSACRKVEVKNSIFANMFRMAGANNWGDNKCIDFRNSSCDSVIIVNNTFVNEQDRIIRQRGAGDGTNIEHFIFNHNTIVNNYGYHGMIEIGRAGQSVQVINNVFMNPFAFGNDTDIVRQSEFEDNLELDQFGHNKMALITTIPDDTVQYTIRNNFVATTQQQDDWYAKWMDANASPRLPFDSGLPPYVTDEIAGKIDMGSAFTTEKLNMGAIPDLGTGIMDLYRLPIDQGGGGKTKIKEPYIDFTTWDCDRISMDYITNTLDCSYNTDAAAYTGADGGQPAGDLRWWGIPLAVKEIAGAVPTEFSLNQNYPNPFNPVTNITYSVPKEAQVTVEVYDMLGRSVAKLVNEKQNAGTYNVDFDASKLSSGAYIYRLSTPEFTLAKKMLLMK